jgi:poly-gamma-glutamate synthesis protein (capsule biosynthesis protein)
MAHQFIDSGADSVVGCHPHVLQGIENYKGKYVAYSLGNFAFGGNSLARNPQTCILQLGFKSLAGQMKSSAMNIVPCLITSSNRRNKQGVLINNYQPKPIYGEEGKRVRDLILNRSTVLKYGVKKMSSPFHMRSS